MPPLPPKRRAKGANLVGVVKLLKGVRKQRPLIGLSPAAEALLEEHVIVSDWYPFDPFLELLHAVNREILGRSDQKALAMGITGGRLALGAYHKQFVRPGDPAESLLAMRHTWRIYFDFGELTAEPDGSNAVRFVVTGYTDMPSFHGQMIVGWHVAAALEAGADARSTILESPWKGGEKLVHRVVYRTDVEPA